MGRLGSLDLARRCARRSGDNLRVLVPCPWNSLSAGNLSVSRRRRAARAAVAKAVKEKVEQPAGLIALFGLSSDQGNAADAEHDVGRIDIASELSPCSARFQQGVNGLEQALASLGEWVAPPMRSPFAEPRPCRAWWPGNR